MQLTFVITPDVATQLRQLAQRECRSVHQQAKWLLMEAVARAIREQEASEEPQTVAVNHVPASIA